MKNPAQNGPVLHHPVLTNEELRKKVLEGYLIVYPKNNSSAELVEFTKHFVQSEFPGEDIRKLEFKLTPTELYEKIYPIKRRYSCHYKLKQILRGLVEETGFDINRNYFDVPRLRAITTNGHTLPEAQLAYSIHRDTWYSNPESQINWWIPLYDVSEKDTFGLYPDYLETPIKNDSGKFSFFDWLEGGGFQTASNEKTGIKRYPVLLEDFDRSNEIKIPMKAGEILFFAAAHLHGTLPNTGNETRYSIDFRTIDTEDLWKRGPKNVDNDSTGTLLVDVFRCSDFSRFPESGIPSHLLVRQ